MQEIQQQGSPSTEHRTAPRRWECSTPVVDYAVRSHRQRPRVPADVHGHKVSLHIPVGVAGRSWRAPGGFQAAEDAVQRVLFQARERRMVILQGWAPSFEWIHAYATMHGLHPSTSKSTKIASSPQDRCTVPPFFHA